MDDIYETLTNIKKMLHEQNYIVTMMLTKNGCIASFPARVLKPQQSNFKVQYEIDYSKDAGVHLTVQWPDGKTMVEKAICPSYACPTMMVGHVAYLCRMMDYAPALAEYLNEKGEIVPEDYFWSKIKKPRSVAVQRKQKKLKELCELWCNDANSRDAAFDEARKLHVEEGFISYLDLAFGDQSE